MKLVNIDKVSERKSFNVSSGALRVTDPCYDLDVWCATQIKAANGKWHVEVGYHRDQSDLNRYAKFAEAIRANIEGGASQKDREFLAAMYEGELRRTEEVISKYIGRVAYIRAWRDGEDVSGDIEFSRMTHRDADVGVDSGQAGFFDLAAFTEINGDKTIKDEFYEGVCDLTLSDTQFGAIPFGAVSSTGYGDGGYSLFTRENENDEAVEAIIVFMPDFEEDDEGEEGWA